MTRRGDDPIDTEYEDPTTTPAGHRSGTSLSRREETAIGRPFEQHDLRSTGLYDAARHGEPIYECVRCGSRAQNLLTVACPGERPIDSIEVLAPDLVELVEKIALRVLAKIDDVSPKQVPAAVRTAVGEALREEQQLLKPLLGRQFEEAQREATIKLRGEIDKVQGVATAKDRAHQTLRSEMHTCIMQSPEIDVVGALDVALATGALDVWCRNYRAWRFAAMKQWAPR